MKTLREEDILLQKAKKVHMIGIGGSGMCPIAEILNHNGYIISGSDVNESDPLKKVRKFATVYMGQCADNIKDDIDLVIYSAAINQQNPELIAAKQKGIPTLERSYALGALTRMYDNVVGVCGTHGKTTVTSLITQILIQNGCQPNAVIGGKLPLVDHYGVVGDSQTMVVESCEFVDTFLQISEDIAVLLNIDNDHLDYFKTMDNLVKSFHKFVSAAKIVFVNGDDELAMKACEDIEGEVITFGFKQTNDYYPANLTVGKYGYQFDCIHQGEVIGHVEMSIPGEHNVLNGLVAFAVSSYLGLSSEGIAESIASFKGAGRRFEFLGDFGFVLADDYGHHPTEIEATLKAAKSLDYKRVVVVFQPFTFSRTAMLLEDFGRVLNIADEVILTPIMGSREVNTYNIYSEDLAKLVNNCRIMDSFEEIAQYIIDTCHEGDLVMTMGCGDIYKAARLIQQHYAK